MIELEVFVIFVTSMFLTFVSIPLVRRFAKSYSLYDYPDTIMPNSIGPVTRRMHSTPIPRLGGIAIFFGFFVSIFLWLSPLSMKPVYLGSLVLFVIGLLDDFLNLPAKFRLVVQVLVTGAVVFSANLGLTELVLSPTLIVGLAKPVGFALSVFIIVGAINAINLVDGLDGLAGGIVLIGVLLLSLLHFLVHGDLLLSLGMSIPLLGSIMGFLCYNTHPASIFMGDGGSNWLGFMVGAITVIVMKGITNGAVDQHGDVLFISALMCLAIPICDTATVIISRIRAGQSPFAADRSHFHHNLMKLGLSHPQAVGTIYFLALIFGVCGIMPAAYPAFNFTWIPYCAAAIIGLLIPGSLLINENLFYRFANLPNRFGLDSQLGSKLKYAVSLLDIINRYCIYSMIAIAPILAGTPPRHIGIAACFGLLLLVLTIGFDKHANFFQSLVTSICCSILLTAINFNTLGIELMGRQLNIQFIYNYSFIILLVSSILVTFITIRRNHLIITPSDFLMVCIPLMFLLVPEPFRSEYKLNVISLRSLVLFMALRALTRRHRLILRRVRTILFAGLSYVVLAAIFGLKIIY